MFISKHRRYSPLGILLRQETRLSKCESTNSIIIMAKNEVKCLDMCWVHLHFLQAEGEKPFDTFVVR
jgi:hypothetical protein